MSSVEGVPEQDRAHIDGLYVGWGWTMYLNSAVSRAAWQGDSAYEERADSHQTCLIKLRSMQIAGERKDVGIRLVRTSERLEAACDLLNDRYAWRGYGRGHRIAADTNHVTFNAEVSAEVVGTITLGVDSADGLAADRTFGPVIDQLRETGATLCELKRFAFGSTVQSKELMAALFHIVFVYGSRTYNCTDLLIEVNERHVRFYETMLGFERLAEPQHHAALDITVQLMRLEVAKIRKYIDGAGAGEQRTSSRSLYPFFFSPEEESGVYKRLAQSESELEANHLSKTGRSPAYVASHDSFHLGNHIAFAMPPARLDRQSAIQ